ncbi:MAG: putative signal transducing protein [Planctomycetota bacterium]
MAKKTSKQMTKATAVKDYVTVAFAEDMDLARQYQQLLADNEIAAVVKRQPEMAQNGFSDIAILVPESLLDEAHALISEEASYDDFFDMLFNDSDNDRTDSGYNENFDNDDDYY